MTTLERPSVEVQFADQLHYLRARRLRITQGELAKAMGVSTNAVSAWETGKSVPHMRVVERLADYFRVRLDDPAVEFRFNVSASQAGRP